MGGNMSFRDALRIRLDIIKPSFQIIEEFNRQQIAKLTPGIKYKFNYNNKSFLLKINIYIFFCVYKEN